MVDTIYAEHEALDYPVSRGVLGRFPGARLIICERYGELFNRSGQNFRMQKHHPALILAVKHGRKVLPAPPDYAVGGRRNFYFSHMLNCLYDCRYCFLQGIYRSANYVLFVNYDDFAESIRCTARDHADTPTWFFSGYDCDSLAMEPVTGFARCFLPVFEELPDARLELRTKSTQVRSLLAREPMANVVTAFSFTTEPAGNALEHRVPELERRLDALAALQRRGWPVAIRFDPLIHHAHFAESFESLCRRIFARIEADRVHSISLGAFRVPRDFYKRMKKLYPREPLFARHLEDRHGTVAYRRDVEDELLEGALAVIAKHVSADAIHPIRGIG